MFMLKKIIIQIIEYCFCIKTILQKQYYNFLMIYYPKKWSDILYKEKFGKNINWKNPTDINEKINWLAFNSDTTLWSKYADKYNVRNYIKEVGLEHILVPLYGKWDTAHDINFNQLPSKFVLKNNHGCGDCILVRDKTSINKQQIINKIDKTLHHRYGIETAEPHYLKIKPCIIAEKLLESENSEGLIDYKIYCFNSQPFNILVCSDRDIEKHKVNFNLYSTKWEYLSDNYFIDKYKNGIKIQRPKHLDKMLEYARILSKPFKHVRVDLYEVDGKVYFSELTFTSTGGRMDFFTPEYLKIMGNQIII